MGCVDAKDQDVSCITPAVHVVKKYSQSSLMLCLSLSKANRGKAGTALSEIDYRI